MTVTTANEWIPDIWAGELNTAVELDIVIFKMFTDRSSWLAGGGDTIKYPASHNLTANDKSAGSDATPEAITETVQSFVVGKHKIVAQEFESIAEIQSKYNMRAQFNERAGYALARAQDSTAAAIIDDNTTQTVGTLGAELSEDNLLSARAYLRNVGAAGPFKAVVAPATYNGLLKIDRFSNSDDYGAGPDAVTKAKLGSIYNMTFYESQLTTGTSPSSSGCVWAEGHFWRVVQKPVTIDTWYSPLAKAHIVAADTIYDAFERQEADEAAAATTVARLFNVRLQSKK